MISQEEILEAPLLIIDDQEVSVRLLEEILRKAGYQNITSLCDSRHALETYARISPRAVILDLHMPYLDGFQIMTQLRDRDKDAYLPVLVLTQLDNRDLRYLALESGAKDFLSKPYDRVEVLVRIRNIVEVHILHDRLKDQNRRLEEEIRKRTQELREAQWDMVHRLARAAEYRDGTTGMHIIRVSHYAACLASQAGLKGEEGEMISVASALHDIGKVAIPDKILQKSTRLTKKEEEILKTHALIGAKLLSGGNAGVLRMAEEIALTHHERWDGSGYPKGLKGEHIPLAGRICGLCNFFDDLTGERPSRKAWSVDKAVGEIKREAGAALDPRLVACFLEILPQIHDIQQKYESGPLEEIL